MRHDGRCKIKHFRFVKASFNILPLDIMEDQSIRTIENIINIYENFRILNSNY